MIATHLPDHFLPRRVFRLTRSDRLTTCQPDWIILKTIQVLKMNRRPYLSFEIHLMSLFLSINGWHYSRITKIILGIQASFHWNLVFQYRLYLMVHIIWTISYKTFFKIWSRVGQINYIKLKRLRWNVWTVSYWRYRFWTLLWPY